MRAGNVSRTTLETRIAVDWTLDGSGDSEAVTGIGFFDHMLDLLAKHSFSDLKVHADGDLDVDSHHTVEDCGIALGQALKEALGDKTGIRRYGSRVLPMDEALVQAAVDLSGRPYFVFQGEIPRVQLGLYDAEMTEEFFRALAFNAGMTLHLRVIYGKNTHHIIEALFKAFAGALGDAAAFDGRVRGVMSSKGVL